MLSNDSQAAFLAKQQALASSVESSKSANVSFNPTEYAFPENSKVSRTVTPWAGNMNPDLLRKISLGEEDVS